MTQASSDLTPQSLLEELVRTARDRAARGTASAADWRAIADIDEDRARTELASYIRATTSPDDVNPYEHHPHSIGAVTGFIGGAAIMVMFWLWGVPYLQDAWAGIDYGPGFATALTYIAPLLLPIGAWLGARRDRARRLQRQGNPTSLPKGSFDELLRRFVRNQNCVRTRVY
ncbi:MAG TPA: hypothetical protein VNZ58_04885 [Thermomicrobiales bacterium]|nr:hypothetical protein [Thermomicrobiales bacterium]